MQYCFGGFNRLFQATYAFGFSLLHRTFLIAVALILFIAIQVHPTTCLGLQSAHALGLRGGSDGQSPRVALLVVEGQAGKCGIRQPSLLFNSLQRCHHCHIRFALSA
jgi:hypothetical protein